MKKSIALFLVVCLLTAAFVSCGKNKDEADTAPNESVTDTTGGNGDTTAPETDAETETETAAADTNTDTDAETLLSTVWATYTEDEKFPAAGGDYNNNVDGAPGRFDITDTASLSSMLILPEENAADIDDAASLVHMMNLNTFTCGAFHVIDAEKVASTAETLRNALASRHWMCGFPDKYVIFTYGNYVVSLFGNEDLVNTFRDKFQSTYPDAAVAYEEAVE